MEPGDNLLVPEKKKKAKKAPIKDLFGELIEAEEMDEQSEQDFKVPLNNKRDDAFNMGNDNYFDQSEKSYTLTIISDPEESGMDKNY